MKPTTWILSTALVVSLLVNVVALRPGRESRTENRPAPRPVEAAPRETGPDVSGMEREIRELREALNAKPKEAPVVKPHETRVSRALSARAALDQLWTDIMSLQRIRRTLGEEECRKEILDRTAKFLGLDEAGRRSFARSVDVLQRDLQTARLRLKAEAKRRIAETRDTSKKSRIMKELYDEYRKEHETLSSRLGENLGTGPRHAALRNQLGAWVLHFEGATARAK